MVGGRWSGEARISYDADQGQLIVERERSSLDPAVDRHAHAAPLALDPNEPLRLRIFLDRSVLEVFANGRISLTTRIYPTRADSLGVALFATDAPARLLALDSWRLASIWET